MALHHKEINDLLDKLASGTISDQQRLRLRDLAADDPFLQDAIEGYETLDRDQTHHLTQLKERVSKSEKSRQPSNAHFWRIAASILLIMTTAGLMYFGSQRELASNRNRTAITFETATNANESPSDRQPAITDRDIPGAIKDVASLPENKSLSEKERRQEETSKSPGSGEETAETATLFYDTDSANDLIGLESDIAASGVPPVAESSRLKMLTQIQGRIFDDVGHPLIGASIRPLSSEEVVTSDLEGGFSLDSDMIQNGVEIAYAGFETRRISPQSMVEMDSIVLKEDQPAMAEIVLHHSKEEPAGKHIAARSSETQYSKMKTRVFDGPVIGWPKYLAYLEQNRRLPEAARKAGISGTVELSFYIDQQGKPQNIKILKSLGYGCDPEAIRLLQQGPSWNPSTSSTDPYVLSITFE